MPTTALTTLLSQTWRAVKKFVTFKKLKNLNLTPKTNSIIDNSLFDRLPVELQILIWEFALPRPCELLFYSRKNGKRTSLVSPEMLLLVHPGSNFHPENPEHRYSALATCKLSRDVALQHFAVRFRKTDGSTIYFHSKDCLSVVIEQHPDWIEVEFPVPFNVERRDMEYWLPVNDLGARLYCNYPNAALPREMACGHTYSWTLFSARVELVK